LLYVSLLCRRAAICRARPCKCQTVPRQAIRTVAQDTEQQSAAALNYQWPPKERERTVRKHDYDAPCPTVGAMRRRWRNGSGTNSSAGLSKFELVPGLIAE